MRWSMALVLCLAGTEAAPAQVSELDVARFRTSRGEDLTVVDGVMNFDPHLVAGGEECAYWVGIEVRDSAGVAILTDEWRGVLACEGELAGESVRTLRVLETFPFAVVSGRYSVEISLAPEGRRGDARRVSLEFESLSPETLTSDLILGRQVGWIDSAGTEAGKWTVRKGEIGIVAEPYLVADASRPDLAYYLEVYQDPEATLTGRIEGVIRRGDGTQLLRTQLAELKGNGQSRPVVGTLPLSGLPPGDYALEVALQLADTTWVRSRGFRMAAAFEEPLAGRDLLTAPLRDYFWSLSDEELARLFDPLEVWLSAGQERKMFAGLNPDGKRRYLINYFANLASDPTWEGDSALDVYLERVQQVNDEFGEKAGRGEQSGWRTDRGRILLIYGAPDERLQRAFPRDNSSPYEIWGYDSAPGYVFLFVDETGFDNYRLVVSTDPRESTLPDWYRRVGSAPVEELSQYFGVRPPVRR